MAVMALLLAASLAAAGCADLLDLDRKAIIVGMGFDAGTSPGTVQVTVQYLVPAGGGGGGGGGGGTLLGGGADSGATVNPVTISATGVNVDDAIRRLRGETNLFFYLGNLGVAVLGQALARQDATAPLDYLLRNGETAEATQIVVAQGTAAALLRSTTPATSEGTALQMFRLLTQAESAYYPLAPNVLWRLVSTGEGPSRSGYAPIMAPSRQGPAFTAAGIALFRQGRMVGQLTDYQGDVADWLIKRAGFPDAIVNLGGAPRPSALRISRRTLSVRVLGPDEVALTLVFRTSIRESQGAILDDRDVAAWEQDAAEQMTRQIRQVLDVLQADGADVLDLADQVLARYPALARDGWPSLFQHLRIDLSVTVRLYEGGRLT
jgi:Ger(x)C family germination protein